MALCGVGGMCCVCVDLGLGTSQAVERSGIRSGIGRARCFAWPDRQMGGVVVVVGAGMDLTLHVT